MASSICAIELLSMVLLVLSSSFRDIFVGPIKVGF